MSNSITLYFAGEAKSVPTKHVISRAVIKSVEQPIATLRTLGQNAAFMKALQDAPNAASVVTVAGGINSGFAEEQRGIIKAAYPKWNREQIDAEINSRVQAKLLEEFPQIWSALNNPVTSFPLDNEDAVGASIEIVKAIIDDKQLSGAEKEAVASAEFWDNQDLREVARVVAAFRSETQL
ncbi:hypothetical protein UFOVP422_26 [uncultured Caudovirales phage]|uniref:Uncharacterized protein n=1 Tax=uncultured Caudovirales phage TaxID=2100421 RepID=A0A6J5M6T6_9CAUD|nr:hypothetical protein UFOVP422_26 [uncultured Caudovirales phage]